MTEFSFKNAAQIREFGEYYFGKEGNIKNVTVFNIEFFVYLIAYRVCEGASLSQTSLDLVKAKAKEHKNSMKMLIFFDKVERVKNDFLYFLNVMKEMEKHPNFQMAYERYVEQAA